MERSTSATYDSAPGNDLESAATAGATVLQFRTGVSRFAEKLRETLEPNLPARELITVIISVALETDLGKSFTLTKGFDKMVQKIADSVMVDPNLRRQALAVVSQVVELKAVAGKKN